MPASSIVAPGSGCGLVNSHEQAGAAMVDILAGRVFGVGVLDEADRHLGRNSELPLREQIRKDIPGATVQRCHLTDVRCVLTSFHGVHPSRQLVQIGR